MEEDGSPSSAKTSSNGKKKMEEFWIKRPEDPSSSSSSSSWGFMKDLCLFSATKASILVMVSLYIFSLLATRWTYVSSIAGSSAFYRYMYLIDFHLKRDEYVLKCTSSNVNITCPANYLPKSMHTSSNRTCPEYFRWIHEDLKNWKEKGIEKHMVEGLKEKAHFRLVIVNGTAYIEQYVKAIQSRDILTFWGILQLLKMYPGMLPDLDLMFQCDDFTLIKKENYIGEKSAHAPPLFHYCGDDSTFDIVFPDWSFWGWPRVNVKPWVQLAKDLKEGNSIKNWTERKPYAFWKGRLKNARLALADCASINDWNTEIVNQDWKKEQKKGFRHSDLKKQCDHRYKIYIEGISWSISNKYILACDSMSLFVDPVYYDFYTRSLIPLEHYWPINRRNLCKSIKFAVNWGNNNTKKAHEIGKAGSDFIFEQIKMKHVYDYMFHVLNEYAKLLKYKPIVAMGAVELCSKDFSCSQGQEMTYKIASMVNRPAEEGPCNLPEPYDSNILQSLRNQKEKNKEIVKMWENKSG